MSPQQEEQQKERVFGIDGNTVEEPETETAELAEAEPEAAVEPEAEPKEEPGKWRIGDKTFATQAEALTYAESQVQSASELDAYRQVLRETLSAVPRAQNVTQEVPQDDFNAEEIYTNPAEFLRKYGERIKTETLAQMQQSQASVEADNRIWREFTDRHPDLTEFRDEITALASRIQPEVHAIAQTKGQASAYDYVATKFKAHVMRLNSALGPKRTLKQAATPTPTGSPAQSVTPKATAKKPLSMAEQIRQIRSRGR